MNEIAKQKNFQERMKNRIKDSIGELMTDDELSEIVKRSMEEIFFKPMILQDGYHKKETVPFVHQLLEKLLKKQVSIAVSEYLGENKDIVLKEIQKIISIGMGQALVDAITFQFSDSLINFQNNLIMNIQNR